MSLRAGDTLSAQKEYNAAITASPDSIRRYNGLANIYVGMQLAPSAFSTIDRYIKKP